MVANRKVTGKAASMPAGLAAGGGVSLGLTVALAALVAKLVDGGTLGEGSIGYCAMGILLLSALAGAAVAVGRIKRQRMLVCSLSGAVYYGLLLAMTAMFFGGQYKGMGVTALMVLCGCALAVLPELRKGRGQGKKSGYKRRHR